MTRRTAPAQTRDTNTAFATQMPRCTAWLILADALADGAVTPPARKNAPGMTGKESELSSLQIQHHPQRRWFELHDVKGWRYRGMYVLGADGNDRAPLRDFGLPVAGCCTMRVWTGRIWETI